MATITRYVDPDATGAGTGVDWTNAYTSLSAYEAAETITNGTDDGVVWCRSSAGTADTTTAAFGTWDCNSLTIQAASGDEAVASGWDVSRYRLDPSTGSGIEINVPASGDYYVIGLQVRGATAGESCIEIINGTGVLYIQSCYGYTTVSGVQGFNCNSSTTGDMHVRNSIVYSTVGGGGSEGIIFDACGTGTAYNCVVYGFEDGIEMDATASGVTVRNCAVFNNTDDIDDVTGATITHCATDDGDGTSGVTAPTWANVFEDAANGDFRLKATDTSLTDAGTPLNGIFTDSINGVDRGTSNWDIGAYEYAGGVDTPILVPTGPLR